MISEIPAFSGFSEQSIIFLDELSRNNSQLWFARNRERYDNYIVIPSKSLIVTLAPFFNQLAPQINTEPKFDKTMLRINKDNRFASNAPYHTFFLIHFRRFKDDNEFYIYIDRKGIEYGLFINNSFGKELFFKKNLPGHKDELVETFRRFDLNGKFNFYEMKKVPELISKEFNIEKDFNRLALTKYILLQKELGKENEIIYTSGLVLEIIKTFSRLYPVYCFSISHNPLALIDKFEEEVGVLR